MNQLTPVLTNMLKRFLLTLSLFMLAQCTPTGSIRHVSVPPPQAAPVEAQHQLPSRPPEEQLEFFNQALDQA
jgi:hypothetical protein